jgi:prophage antirepressor-like protein
MNNMISVFENCEIQIVVENDAPLFEVYSTGMALGYITTTRGKSYPHKVRIEKVISNADIVPVVQNEQRYLTETQLYDFMLEARTDKCKPFRKWLVEEVLPSIRQNGCYISETATKEDIDFESLYGIRRIYDTFFNSTDVVAEYERFFELSKQKRASNHHAFNNQDRIKLSKKIIEALENKARFGIASKEPIYKIMSYQELQTRVHSDITTLYNRYNGGIKTSQKKQIKLLEAEKESLIIELENVKSELESIQQQGDDVPFLEIPYYGFSTNKMYEPKFGKFKATKQYNFWRNNFPKYLVRNHSFTDHVDFTKPICVEMYFLTNGKFDVDNFSKPLLDVIANALNINDKVFTKTICCECAEKVDDHYRDGKIFVRMYNYNDNTLATNE